MNRPKRQTAEVQRFKASTKPVQPQKKPRGKKAQEPVRTLDLKLKKIDMNSFDTADPESEFYELYFTKPDDAITKRLDELDYTKHEYTIGLMSGISNYELKDIDSIPLKSISFDKFQKGEYETDRSKSDEKAYTAKIKKFMNQFPSFKKYKNEDDLSWVVREHRLLFCEMLEYAIPRNNKLPSIESEIVAMMRVMFLALGNTKKHPLYIKYSTILQEMRGNTRYAEAENEFNESELARGGLIPWETVLAKQKEIENRFFAISNKKSKDGYALNQELLLISLYCLIPPLRNEPKFLEFTTTKQDEGDWIYMKDDGTITLDLNEEKKRHDPIELKLPEHLQKILRESHTLYPRQYAFTDTLKYPDLTKKAALMTMNNRLENLFKDYKNKDGVYYKVGASMLRSSYVTFRYQKQLKYNERERIAKAMRTSVEMMERQYLKIITEPMEAITDIPDNIIQNVARPVIGQNPAGQPRLMPRGTVNPPTIMIVQKGSSQESGNNSYKKHLQANNRYYQNNREKILAKQKEYKKTHPEQKILDAKRKILKFLNTDPEYKNVVKQATINKYAIRLVNGVYV